MDLYRGILMGFQWISVDDNQGLVNVPIKHHPTIGKVISRYFFRWGSKSQGTFAKFANLYISYSSGRQTSHWQACENPKDVDDFPSEHGSLAYVPMPWFLCWKGSDIIAKSHGPRWAKHQASGGVGPLPTWTGCGDSRAARLCGRRGHGALGPWGMEQVTFTWLYYPLVNLQKAIENDHL